MVGLLRQQIKSGKNSAEPAATAPPPRALAPAARATLAARLGSVASTAGGQHQPPQQAQQSIPGMEPVEPKRPRRAAKSDFKIEDELFSTLSGGVSGWAAGGSGSSIIASAAAPSKPVAAANSASLPPGVASWVTDLNRYNELLGLAPLSDDDEFEEAGAAQEKAAPVDDASADGYGYDCEAIPDDVLAYAISYGVEAAGLPEKYWSFLEQVSNLQAV